MARGYSRGYADVLNVDMLPGVRAKLNTDGGFMVRLTNKTGAASVKGTLVSSSHGTDNAFNTAAANEVDCIGVVYQDAVPDASECWVTVYGRAQILIEDGTASTRGSWVYPSTTDAGRVDITNAAPPGGGIPEIDTHFRECGHCIESKGSGTDVLAWCMIHFN